MNNTQRGLLALTATVYVAFNLLELFGQAGRLSTLLKYAGVLLCLLVALLSDTRRVNPADHRALLLGLTLTALSDTFLLFSELLWVGLLCFCLVHLTYIRRVNPIAFVPLLLATLAVLLLLLAAEWLAVGPPLILSLAVLYALLFGLDLLFALRAAHLPQSTQRVLLAGLVLFALCDLNVAVSHLATGALQQAASSLIWIFYLPSQGLLALSGIRFAGAAEQRT